LDEGVYHASLSTCYRVLRQAGDVQERRAQGPHPPRQKPELLAPGPNQGWSWDITDLPGPVKGQYSRLYVILDIYSRAVVGWLLAPTEAAGLAAALIRATLRRQGVTRGPLTLHADHGAAMASQPVAALVTEPGVTKSHARPHTSMYFVKRISPRAFCVVHFTRLWITTFSGINAPRPRSVRK